MPCACPSQYGFGVANASTYDAAYATVNNTAISEWAVAVYRGQGQPTLVRSQRLATTAAGSTVTAPGYPNLFIPTQDVHFITQQQFTTGLPQADARVFPVRCPDGSPSGVIVAEFTQTVSCVLPRRRLTRTQMFVHWLAANVRVLLRRPAVHVLRRRLLVPLALEPRLRGRARCRDRGARQHVHVRVLRQGARAD
jgi:hypothetical protein